MSKLRKAARGQDCQVRVPGACNGRPETVVLAHYRMPGQSGIGLKASDFLGAWACSDCHDAVDGRKPMGVERDVLRLWHLEGVMRTLAELERLGLLGVSR